jgi:hypothetical protein
VSNVLLRKSYFADAAIPAFTLVKIGSDSSHVAAATGPADVVIGATGEVGPAAGERVDISLIGIEYITAGAAFAAGVPLTSDGSGRVVAAAPAAGTNANLCGHSLEAATALGDQVRVHLGPSVMQG